MPRIHNTIDIRRLGAADEDALLAHYRRLGSEGLGRRFGFAPGPGFIEHYVARTLGGRAVVLAFIDEGTIRGVGELHDLSDGIFGAGPSAEAAFSVEPEWQGHGIGTKLMQKVLRTAQVRGVRRLVVFCTQSNQRMRRLAEKGRFAMEIAGSEAIGNKELPRPTPARLWADGCAAAFDLGLAACDAAQTMIEGLPVAEPTSPAQPSGVVVPLCTEPRDDPRPTRP